MTSQLNDKHTMSSNDVTDVMKDGSGGGRRRSSTWEKRLIKKPSYEREIRIAVVGPRDCGKTGEWNVRKVMMLCAKLRRIVAYGDKIQLVLASA